jgi:dihydroorotase
MKRTIIKNGLIINKGETIQGDIMIEGQRIIKIGGIINESGKEINAEGHWIIPGIIDDQVHFREPGLTHKADIFSESRAAVAGGVTSFMEMPNTSPPAVTAEKLEEKYAIAASRSWCNYSFFMGTTNDNYDELMSLDYTQVCGIKIFMGSSTGNMLVDNMSVLEKIFAQAPTLIATHCEDEATITKRSLFYSDAYGDALDAAFHPMIRNERACLLSSSLAVNLARKHNTRLHILHISTMEELALFDNLLAINDKRITSEVCVHHLWFTADDYEKLGNQIKCNPAIKSDRHAPALFDALLDGRLDVIATDHAPHTWEEKSKPYAQAPSGLPLVQHALPMMMKWVHAGRMSKEMLVEKMCHNPSIAFNIQNRGYIEGDFFADIAIVDPDHEWKVEKENILYKCGWSPLEHTPLKGKVMHTFINGSHVYDNGQFSVPGMGKRLTFNGPH